MVAAESGTAPGEPLYARVARRATSWGPGGTVGLVVGATAPEELATIRAIAPALAFLVPGVGAQGGDEGPVLRDGPARTGAAATRAGGGLLVNVSRGIASAAIDRNDAAGDPAAATVGGTSKDRPTDPGARIEAAARDWAARLRVLP